MDYIAYGSTVASTNLQKTGDTMTGNLTLNSGLIVSSGNAITLGQGASDSFILDEHVQQRIAGAWVNFNGSSTVTIRDDYNVSSITDNGVGRYTLNFDTAFANTNYCFTIMARDADASEPGAANLAAVTSNSTKTTSALKVISAYAPTTTASDTTEYNVIIFGELS